VSGFAQRRRVKNGVLVDDVRHSRKSDTLTEIMIELAFADDRHSEAGNVTRLD